tara:strand:- start:254 stop:631 length:378 start_codon:yes stop_codon:yes gene_type:complete
MYFVDKNKTSCVFISLFFWFSACKEDPARHLNLGDWYLNKGLIEEAIDEYKEVTRAFAGNASSLTREENDILGKAHFKLAIAYTKWGMWEFALNEAKKSFNVQPNKDSHDLVELIQQKLALRTDS